MTPADVLALVERLEADCHGDCYRPKRCLTCQAAAALAELVEARQAELEAAWAAAYWAIVKQKPIEELIADNERAADRPEKD